MPSAWHFCRHDLGDADGDRRKGRAGRFLQATVEHCSCPCLPFLWQGLAQPVKWSSPKRISKMALSFPSSWHWKVLQFFFLACGLPTWRRWFLSQSCSQSKVELVWRGWLFGPVVKMPVKIRSQSYIVWVFGGVNQWIRLHVHSFSKPEWQHWTIHQNSKEAFWKDCRHREDFICLSSVLAVCTFSLLHQAILHSSPHATV